LAFLQAKAIHQQTRRDVIGNEMRGTGRRELCWRIIYILQRE